VLPLSPKAKVDVSERGASAPRVQDPASETLIMSINYPLRLFSTLVLASVALLTPNAGDAWPVLVSGGGRNYGKDVVVANDGSVFVAGMIGPASGLQGGGPAPQRTSAGPAGPLDAFVLRADPDGKVLWMRSFGGPAVEMPHAVAVSPRAEAVVSGFFTGSGPYGPEGRMVGSAGGRDGFVAFFSATGELRSAFTVGGEGDDEIFQHALTDSGDVVIAGPFERHLAFGGNTLVSAGGKDGFVARVDATGRPRWTRRIGGTGEDWALAVVCDDEGNVYVGGAFSGEARFESDTPGTAQVHRSTGNWDAFIARYSGTTGRLTDVLTFGGTGRDWIGAGGLAWKRGSLYAIGDFEGRIEPRSGWALRSAGAADVFMLKLDSGLQVQAAARFGGTGADRGHRIMAGDDGSIWATGWLRGTAGDVERAGAAGEAVKATGADPDALTSVFVVRLDGTGQPLWARAFGGAGAVSGPTGTETYSNIGTGLALKHDGSAVVTGRLTGRLRTDDTEIDAGPLSAFVVRLDAEGRMTSQTSLQQPAAVWSGPDPTRPR
jgi:hypothetical protein